VAAARARAAAGECVRDRAARRARRRRRGSGGRLLRHALGKVVRLARRRRRVAADRRGAAADHVREDGGGRVSVLEQYRGLYSAIERRDEGDVAARLEALYDPRLMFQDTFVTVLGRDEFVEMNRRALKNTRAIETEIFESSETAEQLFMTWKMRYVTRLGPTLVIEG